MKEYEIWWQEQPYCAHPRRIIFVEAENPDDAELIAKDHIKRTYGCGMFGVRSVTEVKQLPKGRVL